VPFCSECGAEVPENGAFCPACGAPVPAKVGGMTAEIQRPTVNVWAAVVLSLVFPGLGLLYLGLKRRGAVFLVLGLVLVAAVVVEVGVVLYPRVPDRRRVRCP
jgi:predicted amidophosphoribosyltransferase